MKCPACKDKGVFTVLEQDEDGKVTGKTEVVCSCSEPQDKPVKKKK